MAPSAVCDTRDDDQRRPGREEQPGSECDLDPREQAPHQPGVHGAWDAQRAEGSVDRRGIAQFRDAAEQQHGGAGDHGEEEGARHAVILPHPPLWCWPCH